MQKAFQFLALNDEKERLIRSRSLYQSLGIGDVYEQLMYRINLELNQLICDESFDRDFDALLNKIGQGKFTLETITNISFQVHPVFH